MINHIKIIKQIISLLTVGSIITLAGCASNNNEASSKKNTFIGMYNHIAPTEPDTVYPAFTWLPKGFVSTQSKSNDVPTPIKYSVTGAAAENTSCIISYTDAKGSWQVGKATGTTYLYSKKMKSAIVKVNCGLAGSGAYAFTINTYFFVGKKSYSSFWEFKNLPFQIK